jgi:hypothetical protein
MSDGLRNLIAGIALLAFTVTFFQSIIDFKPLIYPGKIGRTSCRERV